MRIPTFPFLVAGVGFFLLGIGVIILADAALGVGIACYGTCTVLLWQNLKHLKRIQRLERPPIWDSRLEPSEESKEAT